MRLLCDEMLRGLARWLRAAGHDARTVREGIGDTELLRCARGERRRLITCDHKLLGFRDAADVVVLLSSNRIEPAARELSARLPLDWLYAPFSRCMECNCRLETAGPADRERLPAKVSRRGLPVLKCAECGRLYWQGSHAERIRRRLETWQAMQSGGDSGML